MPTRMHHESDLNAHYPSSNLAGRLPTSHHEVAIGKEHPLASVPFCSIEEVDGTRRYAFEDGRSWLSSIRLPAAS